MRKSHIAIIVTIALFILFPGILMKTLGVLLLPALLLAIPAVIIMTLIGRSGVARGAGAFAMFSALRGMSRRKSTRSSH